MWDKAERHFQRSLALFKQTKKTLDVANVELNLQQVLHFAGKEVDIARIREATRTLDQAGDPRSAKGHELLKELEG